MSPSSDHDWVRRAGALLQGCVSANLVAVTAADQLEELLTCQPSAAPKAVA